MQEDVHQLLKARSEIDEQIRRRKTELTILFTDVVGSTSYFDRFGDTAGLLLIQRHDDFVTSAVLEFQGVVIKTIGDSVMAEFPQPLLAVRAAVEIQLRVFRHNQSLIESERLQVRVGINCGVGFRRGTDFLGDAVNVAARITKRSGSAQILVSGPVHEATIGTEICCRSVGNPSLAGKAEAGELYEVIWTNADDYDQLRSRVNVVRVDNSLYSEGEPHNNFMLQTPPSATGELHMLPPAPGRYEILARVGVGGMGVVFKARDRETGEIVALKVLKPEIADRASLMESLKNELRLARKITHKNVCRIYDFNRTGDVASISMEFVQGESLRHVLNRFGAFSPGKAVKIARQICDGLCEAHSQGIVHRDIKPENFMIDESGNVKLMDFGLAHLLKESSTAAVGTPSYMAPEQVQGALYDQRADIYALGLVLFEIFTGSAAFNGDTPIAVALQQIVEAPRNPRDLEQTVPEHIERAILRCLEKDPTKRFPSVEELKESFLDVSLPPQGNFLARARLGMRHGLLATLGFVALAAGLVTAVVMYDHSTKNKQEVASFQNAQSVDTEELWNTFLKNHREGQLSFAAQERLNKLRIQAEEKSKIKFDQNVTANASQPSPAAGIVQVPPVVRKQDPPTEARETGDTKPRPNWTVLIDTAAIPGGVFMMGKEDGKKDEKPRHRVSLEGFQMSRTEITNRQYIAFLEATGHPRPKDPAFAGNYLMNYPNLPVLNVSYQDAVDFCNWASAKYAVTVRLPTEAEWEYAARGGKKDVLYPWGFESPSTRARYKEKDSRRVQTVEQTAFPPNGFGLYNMSGNVWEWVSDFYSRDYYADSPIKNPTGPERGIRRAIRGGSWADDETQLRNANRASRDPSEHSDKLGFRIVVKSSVRPGRPQLSSTNQHLPQVGSPVR